VKTTGLLIPAFSTRRSGDLGIGDTLAVREWIDWAAKHHVGFLQLLPINENGADESPYSGISSIALDPIYIAFEPELIPCLTRS
jgi:4-alpha-glucanotransferase